jgi:hypothetical protein
VKDIAADQTEGTLEIERTHDLAAEHGRLEIRCMAVDEVDHEIRDFLAVRVPRRAVRQHRRDVLAEQARDVPAPRREAVVERRGNQHLDDRLLRPAAGFGIEIGLLHVGETRRHDDAGGVMFGERAARQGA